MKKYQIVVSKSADKELTKLPLQIIKKVVPILESLSIDPRPSGCKKIKGFSDLWRIRIGNYRIIYSIQEVILLIEIQAIGHRKDIYD